MRQPKLLLSPRAEADLADIGSYIADDNPARAMSFVLELRDFMQKVAANPYVGRRRDDLRAGLRSVPFIGYNYVVYYRVMSRRSGIRLSASYMARATWGGFCNRQSIRFTIGVCTHLARLWMPP